MIHKKWNHLPQGISQILQCNVTNGKETKYIYL